MNPERESWIILFESCLSELEQKIAELRERLGGLKEPLYSESVDTLAFSIRAWNVLRYANIKTIGELVQLNRYDVRRLKNCGKVTVADIEQALAERGLRLRPLPGESRE